MKNYQDKMFSEKCEEPLDSQKMGANLAVRLTKFTLDIFSHDYNIFFNIVRASVAMVFKKFESDQCPLPRISYTVRKSRAKFRRGQRWR
jgi:hypothetical protein